jgi:two-component system KDP operon response regulator KdpE
MSARRPRILVIDHASRVRRMLRPALEAAGYDGVSADTGRKGLAEIKRNPPDAVVLDLGLPYADGGEVLRKARELYQGPIIVLSARDQDAESVEALDAGADDYVEKPFRIGDLLGRLRVSLLRRLVGRLGATTVVHADGLAIDLSRRLVTRDGKPIHLSPKEYELLARLARADGKVLTHRELLVRMWGPAHTNDSQYLRVLVGQLRQKIELDPSAPRLLITEPAVGYRLLPDEVARAS